jgi:hypothetical protein
MPVSGSVTNATGSVKGISVTGLSTPTRATGVGNNGTYGGTTSPVGSTRAQVQHVVLLSATTGACAREGSAGGYAANELTVRLTSVVYADLPNSMTTIPPAADLPLTFTAGTWLTTSDGAHRVITPYFMKAKSNGGMGSDTTATSGTVTLTAADSTHYAGSYDLNFGADHITGSFDAPWC